MNAASQRRLTPLLGLLALLLGALWLALLLGYGRGVHWDAPRAAPPSPVSGHPASLPTPKPLAEFAPVWQQSLFSPDRKPEAHAANGGSSIGDLSLTGIILTPQLHMALLHDKNGDRELRLREGQSLPDGSLRLIEVKPRSVILDSAQGRTELKLPAGAGVDMVKSPDAPVPPQPGANMRPPRYIPPPYNPAQDDRLRKLKAAVMQRRAASKAENSEGVH
ncbi:MAG: hypothetical protein RSP_28890 [Rhodanobacter sp.]